MSEDDLYEHPLATRYADKQLSAVWSNQKKFSTWRRLWIALAQAEMELGLKDITPAMIEEMQQSVDDIDFAYAEQKEKELRHDVMAHVHTFGIKCPGWSILNFKFVKEAVEVMIEVNVA